MIRSKHSRKCGYKSLISSYVAWIIYSRNLYAELQHFFAFAYAVSQKKFRVLYCLYADCKKRPCDSDDRAFSHFRCIFAFYQPWKRPSGSQFSRRCNNSRFTRCKMAITLNYALRDNWRSRKKKREKNARTKFINTALNSDPLISHSNISSIASLKAGKLGENYGAWLVLRKCMYLFGSW